MSPQERYIATLVKKVRAANERLRMAKEAAASPAQNVIWAEEAREHAIKALLAAVEL